MRVAKLESQLMMWSQRLWDADVGAQEKQNIAAKMLALNVALSGVTTKLTGEIAPVEGGAAGWGRKGHWIS